MVVGDGRPARRLAAALAGEIGIDPAEVPFASSTAGAYAVATGPLLVRSAEDAAERAPGWRRSRAAVVVVDAAVTGSERSWATHLIAALRPTGRVGGGRLHLQDRGHQPPGPRPWAVSTPWPSRTSTPP